MSDNANESAYPTAMTAGLTKRELFAAMAMQGMLSIEFATPQRDVELGGFPTKVARWSAAFADALLAELEPPK